MTKLDVLSGIPKLKVATHYEHKGRKLEGEMPATLEELAECEVKYIELDGFGGDIANSKQFSDLPKNA